MGLLGQIDMELQKDLIDFVKAQKEKLYPHTLGVKMDDVAARNIEKLRKRYPEDFDEERSRHREQQ